MMRSRSHALLTVGMVVAIAALIAATAFILGRSTGSPSTPASQVTQEASGTKEATENSRQQKRTAKEALFYPPERLGAMIASTIAKSVQIECKDKYYGAGWIYDTSYTPMYREKDFEVGAEGKDLLVVTAAHIINDCRSDPSTIKVIIDGEESPSQLLNWHKKIDLATIAVEAKNPGLKGSEEVQQGMWALAVGWPFDDNLTPTIGRVIEVEDSRLYIDVRECPRFG